VPVDLAAVDRAPAVRVALPEYPFDRRRCWAEPPENRPAAGSGASVEEPLQLPTWSRAEPLPGTAPVDGRWLVVGDASGAVGKALAARGAQILSEVDGQIDGVVSLIGAQRRGGPADHVERAVCEIGRVAAAVAERPPRHWVQVTVGAQQVESADRPDAAVASVLALPRVLAQEMPGLRWRSLDLDGEDNGRPAEMSALGWRSFDLDGDGRPAEMSALRRRSLALDGGDRADAVADLVGDSGRPAETPAPRSRSFDLDGARANAIAAEVANLVADNGRPAEIAVRAGLRWRRGMTVWRPDASPLTGLGVVVIIGGGGDVGLAMAEHLASVHAATVVVTSRTASDDRTRRIGALAARGLSVSLRQVDASDLETTKALLAELVAKHGRIDLVVHAAGVVASAGVGPLRTLAPDVVQAHVRAKVRGALVLEEALAGLPDKPRAVLLMSSATTLVGGLGLGPYAAANRFLDAMAERRRDDTTAWFSVAWDGWRVGPDGGERTVAIWHSLGAQDGMRSLDRLLTAAFHGHLPPVIGVSPSDLNERMAAEATRGQEMSESADDSEKLLCALWTDVLGFEVRDRDADFFALGGHSLLATGMLARLRDDHGVDLRLSDLLAHPTIAGLAPLVRVRAQKKAPTQQEITPRQDGDFPLTPVQRAYWAGRNNARLGGVACHFYLEYDCPDLDLDRYQAAWRAVIDRHPMLRTVITQDGRNLTFDDVPPYRIRRHDLTGTAEPQRKLAALRERIAHRLPRHDRWPLVEIQAAVLPGGRTRLFIGVDVLVCDVASYLIADREVRLYYEGHELPEPGITFAQYVAEAERAVSASELARARDYWLARIPELPEAPALPAAGEAGPRRFRRLAARLEPDRWNALKRRAGELGVTPTAMLLTAYAEALGEWSGTERFALTLTRYDRRQVHPDVNRLVGDFTTLQIHEVESATAGAFAERAQATQRRLFADLDHGAFTGLDVLAEKNYLVPVVFTGAVGVEDLLEEPHDLDWVGEQVHAVSQTPQVVLDHQVYVQRGALLVQWDVLEAEVDPVQAGQVFDRYVRRLRELAGPPDNAVPFQQGTSRPLFLIHPSGGDVLCYAELATRLGQDQTVIALTDPELAGLDAPADMPALVRQYVDAIRACQPEGPYRLGGWSMGGTVAHEVAVELTGAGDEVELVVMIDSNLPQHITEITPAPGSDVDGEVCLRFLRSLEAARGIDLGADDALAALTPAARREAIAERMRDHGLAGSTTDLRLAVFARHLRMLADHAARRLDTAVLLFRASRPSPRNAGIGMGVDDVPGADLGWTPFVGGRFETVDVDAHHYSVLREPAVGVIATRLRAALEENDV
jgi:thioesterase domain-containing protein/NADP-dependent 3-hydroxy acid dehydrogenase YdfG